MKRALVLIGIFCWAAYPILLLDVIIPVIHDPHTWIPVALREVIKRCLAPYLGFHAVAVLLGVLAASRIIPLHPRNQRRAMKYLTYFSTGIITLDIVVVVLACVGFLVVGLWTHPR